MSLFGFPGPVVVRVHLSGSGFRGSGVEVWDLGVQGWRFGV